MTAGYGYYLQNRVYRRHEVHVVGENPKVSTPLFELTQERKPVQFASVWLKPDRVKALGRVLIEALEPRIKAALGKHPFRSHFHVESTSEPFLTGVQHELPNIRNV